MNTTDSRITIQPVDVKGIFYKKNARLAKYIPEFVYNYIKRVVRQKDINYIIEKHGHKHDMDFVNALVEEFHARIGIKGEENIPKEGCYIFAANHPLGGFDGIVFMNIIGARYSKFKFLVNDILMNLLNLRGLFIPINKHGKQGLEAIYQIDKAFSEGEQILTFPAGLVSRKIKGRIIDLQWQKSFILKSIKYKRDIIPVHFSGQNTNFFYRLSNLRKFLGIRTNIEMFYLADETFKHRNKNLTVTFGEAIPWQTFDNSKKPIEWAKWVKEKVYAQVGIYNLPV